MRPAFLDEKIIREHIILLQNSGEKFSYQKLQESLAGVLVHPKTGKPFGLTSIYYHVRKSPQLLSLVEAKEEPIIILLPDKPMLTKWLQTKVNNGVVVAIKDLPQVNVGERDVYGWHGDLMWLVKTKNVWHPFVRGLPWLQNSPPPFDVVLRKVKVTVTYQ